MLILNGCFIPFITLKVFLSCSSFRHKTKFSVVCIEFFSELSLKHENQTRQFISASNAFPSHLKTDAYSSTDHFKTVHEVVDVGTGGLEVEEFLRKYRRTCLNHPTAAVW